MAVTVIDEWDRLTRFLESARIAFAREASTWTTVAEPGAVRIVSPAEHAGYDVELPKHMAAVGDAEILHASVLIHSYALAESAAAERLGIDLRGLAGIEDWGTRLLRAAGRDWRSVRGGRAGAVEVAVVRNAFAHGMRRIDAPAHARLQAAGVAGWPIGSRVSLAYQHLRGYRHRLRSLMRAGGISG